MWPFGPVECQHEWVVVSTNFTPPLKRGVSGNIGNEQMSKYVYGFTSIAQKCVHCGRITIDEYSGKIVLPEFKGEQHESSKEGDISEYGDINDKKKGQSHTVTGDKSKLKEEKV